MVAGKKWGREQKTLKKIIVQYIDQKKDYGCQLYITASQERLKKQQHTQGR